MIPESIGIHIASDAIQTLFEKLKSKEIGLGAEDATLRLSLQKRLYHQKSRSLQVLQLFVKQFLLVIFSILLAYLITGDWLKLLFFRLVKS